MGVSGGACLGRTRYRSVTGVCECARSLHVLCPSCSGVVLWLPADAPLCSRISAGGCRHYCLGCSACELWVCSAHLPFGMYTCMLPACSLWHSCSFGALCCPVFLPWCALAGTPWQRSPLTKQSLGFAVHFACVSGGWYLGLAPGATLPVASTGHVLCPGLGPKVTPDLRNCRLGVCTCKHE